MNHIDENNIENLERVNKRKKLWYYMDELKNDKFNPASIISNYDTPSNKIKQDIWKYLPKKIEYCLSEVNKKLLEVESDPEKLR